MTTEGQRIVSTLQQDGKLVVECVPATIPEPSGSEVLVRVEAAPINPSDLAMLFGPADLENAEYSTGRIIARMPEPAVRAMKGRIGIPMPVGNEGAGTVIAAGDAPEAQALLGKRVACVPGGMYATHRIAFAQMCMPLPDDLPIELGAASYVNPLTALGFVETMRAEGFTGIIHTAAASNLGQMLVKLCQEESVPLVNIVRKSEQVELLRALGAEHIVNSSEPDFMVQLIAAIEATGARLAFDAIGGGTLASQILTAIEATSKVGGYTFYGSTDPKKVYIYGALDLGPTIVNRNFGLTWEIAGWLLIPFLMKLPPQDGARLRERVAQGLTTTFASRFKGQANLVEMLRKANATAFNAKATGKKYLVVPHG
jgi:NADPH:quinone reductase-like Zn-dependent oxidoreductase